MDFKWDVILRDDPCGLSLSFSYTLQPCKLLISLCLPILVCILLPATALPQNSVENTGHSSMYQERGIPYIQNYMPEQYNAGPDNWSAVQSKEGVMYFGNKNGILEYDGVSWRLIQLPNRGVVRSLAIDRKLVKLLEGCLRLGRFYSRG